MTQPDHVPPHARDALAAYDAAVDDARLLAREAWERLSYKEVMILHVRLGDAAERLCRECLVDGWDEDAKKSARAWIGDAVGRPREKISSETRAERVSLAVDLWLARHRARR